MSLFPVNVASGLADRTSAIIATISTGFVNATVVGGAGDLFTQASNTGVYAIERDFITPAYNFEHSLSGLNYMASNSYVQSLLTSFDTHCRNEAGVTFNVYCLNSGLQVAEPFASLWAASRGSALYARNVFSATDVTLATTVKRGTSSFTFAAGTDLGTGGTSNYAAGNTGAQKLKCVLAPGVQTTASLVVSVSGLDDFGTAQYTSATLPTSTPGGSATCSPAVRMRTVTNVNAVGTGEGMRNSDYVSIINIRERTIAL
jgi:hypothetical protein